MFHYIHIKSKAIMNILYKCNLSLIIKITSWHHKTSPCNEHPLTPHFYIVKLGFTGVYFFFLFLFQNIDCGYPQSMF